MLLVSHGRRSQIPVPGIGVETDAHNTLQAHRDESGATAIEYGLIAALISVVTIAAITAVGTQLSTTFNTISTDLSTANGN